MDELIIMMLMIIMIMMHAESESEREKETVCHFFKKHVKKRAVHVCEREERK
jgi:hypothetical protein